MRKIAILCISLVFLFAGSFVLFVSEEKRWVYFNGSKAEAFAKQLLTHEGMNEHLETPNQFLNYSISASRDGYVLLSKHDDHERVYGYFPQHKPDFYEDLNAQTWTFIAGNWYVMNESLQFQN